MNSEKHNLIFVTGASRSGTTMMSRILGNNSQILWLHEMHYFGDLFDPYDEDVEPLTNSQAVDVAAEVVRRAKTGIWGRKVTDDDKALARHIFESRQYSDNSYFSIFGAVLNELVRSEEKHYACDQTPRNIYYAKTLLRHYPGAKIVHIIRDPRAVLASQKYRWQRAKLGAKTPWYESLRNRSNYHPVTISKLWNKATSAAFSLKNEKAVYVVKFENLLSDPEAQLRQICEFLEVDYESNMLEVPQIGSSRFSDKGQKKGLNSDAIDSWKGRLSKSEISICEKRNAVLMKHLDYLPTLNPTDTDRLGEFMQMLLYPVHLFSMLIINPKRAIIHLKGIMRV